MHSSPYAENLTNKLHGAVCKYLYMYTSGYLDHFIISYYHIIPGPFYYLPSPSPISMDKCGPCHCITFIPTQKGAGHKFFETHDHRDVTQLYYGKIRGNTVVQCHKSPSTISDDLTSIYQEHKRGAQRQGQYVCNIIVYVTRQVQVIHSTCRLVRLFEWFNPIARARTHARTHTHYGA